MELTDEQYQALQDQLAAAEARLAEVGKRERAQEAKDYVASIGELGLSEYPGFLAKVEQIMLADDGDAALLLSEDGKDSVLTATEIVKDLISSLPKGDDGKILLSGQHIQVDDDRRPPLDNGDELTQEQKTANAKAYLGLDDKKRPRNVRA